MLFVEKKLGHDCTWIDLDVDKIKNMEDLSDVYGLDKETIEYALDRNERAHMDYHRETGTVTFIYNVLDLEKDKEYYEAIPMTFIVEKQLIEEMDKGKDEISALLRQKTTKKNLFALSDLETGMVYLTAAAKQNRLLLEHIQGHALYRNFNEVETHQLVSMTDLISQVLQQLSASYNNILNNNLNDNLTTLTIISVLLAILAVITGFFGMNVPLPFADEPNAWVYILIASLILWVVLAQYLKNIARN